MKLIKLEDCKSEYTTVDDEDYKYLTLYKWYKTRGYARRSITVNGKQMKQVMHRVVLDAPLGFMIDHKDGDKVNNQKSNLRFCTNSQNQANSKLSTRNSTGFKGVHKNRKTSKFVAQCKIMGKYFYIGSFSNVVDAAKAYDSFLIENRGEFARTNFLTSL